MPTPPSGGRWGQRKPDEPAVRRLLLLCGDPDRLDPGDPPVRHRALGLPRARRRRRLRRPDVAGRSAAGSRAGVDGRGGSPGRARVAQPGPSLVVPAAAHPPGRRPVGDRTVAGLVVAALAPPGSRSPGADARISSDVEAAVVSLHETREAIRPPCSGYIESRRSGSARWLPRSTRAPRHPPRRRRPRQHLCPAAGCV